MDINSIREKIIDDSEYRLLLDKILVENTGGGIISSVIIRAISGVLKQEEKIMVLEYVKAEMNNHKASADSYKSNDKLYNLYMTYYKQAELIYTLIVLLFEYQNKKVLGKDAIIMNRIVFLLIYSSLGGL